MEQIAKDNNSEPNCTKFTNGSFTGIGATYSDVVEDLFTGNLWPRYVQIIRSVLIKDIEKCQRLGCENSLPQRQE